MTNPYLADTTDRAGRDAFRKLGADDRIFGTMRLALEYGIAPENMAVGALAGIAVLLRDADQYDVPEGLRFPNWHDLKRDNLDRLLRWIWENENVSFHRELVDLTFAARAPLTKLAGV